MEYFLWDPCPAEVWPQAIMVTVIKRGYQLIIGDKDFQSLEDINNVPFDTDRGSEAMVSLLHTVYNKLEHDPLPLHQETAYRMNAQYVMKGIIFYY